MIEVNGREYASTDDMPVRVRAAYDRAMAEKPELHSGARLAAKLNARIIMSGAEVNHAGEMSVDARHLYHEAADVHIILLQRLDQRHHGAFAVEHDEVRLRRNCLVAQFIELADRECFRFTNQPLTVWNLIGIVETRAGRGQRHDVNAVPHLTG